MFAGGTSSMASFFDAKLDGASALELRQIGKLLSRANNSFVFDHMPFVVRYLERCRAVDHKLAKSATRDLFGSAISGVRGGPIARHATSTSRSVKGLPPRSRRSRLSPAFDLCDSVLKAAEHNIDRTLKDGEALDE